MLSGLFRVKCDGLTFIFRKATIADFLALKSCPAIFSLKSENQPVENLIQTIEQDNEEDGDEKNALISRCLVNLNANRRKYRKFKAVLTLEHILAVKEIREFLYLRLITQSIGFLPITTIDRTKALSIYQLYKGRNYAREYFGEDTLNKITEYAFNVVIHNVGVADDNRRAREAASHG